MKHEGFTLHTAMHNNAYGYAQQCIRLCTMMHTAMHNGGFFLRTLAKSWHRQCKANREIRVIRA